MNRADFHCQQCGMCCSVLLPFCHALVKVPETKKYECLHQGTGKKPEGCVNYPFNPDGTLMVDQVKICPEVRRLINREKWRAVFMAWFGPVKITLKAKGKEKSRLG